MDLALVLLRFPDVSRTAAFLLRSLVSNQLRVVDMFGLLGDGDYAICLPHTDHKGAAIVAARVRTQMAGFSPRVGVATYGQDGTDFVGLLATAESRLC